MSTNLMVGRRDRVVRNAWGEWIDSFKWDCFITMTFDCRRDPVGTLTGGRWLHKTSGAIRSAMFVEPFNKMDGYHLHGLMYVPDKVNSLKPFMDSLEKRAKDKFGPARILPAYGGSAAAYVTKYTGHLDTAGIEFDLLGDWENS